MKGEINYIIVALVMVVFFVISFITNIIGPIIPEFIKSYDLSLVLASLLPLSFFFAYGIFSIPSGIYLERFGGKKMMIFAFAVSLIGALSISIYPNYYSILFSFSGLFMNYFPKFNVGFSQFISNWTFKGIEWLQLFLHSGISLILLSSGITSPPS